ncbi:helix-turn-helix domain-containing protein [Streptomyces caatingaensis]|uniref:helix-turn-helix domain-containing protein n=1 Tax=Streptomyces caatingaensis TaxID=1678637 RepID=UPI00099B9515|nr:helix-turn-helix transcriptional regulator [Streptomyces caatingaensis]
MHLRDKGRFDELVRLKGLSQRTLAQRAHVTQAFISLVAHGRRGVRPETAWRIASALGVFTEELFVASGQESPPRQPPRNFNRMHFSKRP